jgi:ferredoxin
MIKTIQFNLNDRPLSIEVDDERTLLWVLRTDLGLTGAKFGCGEGLCGACTVLVDDEAVASCQICNVPTDFNAFLRISVDNRVTCFVGKIEMGQGPMTSFAQMLAEELDVAYESVDMVMGDTDRCGFLADFRHSMCGKTYLQLTPPGAFICCSDS